MKRTLPLLFTLAFAFTTASAQVGDPRHTVSVGVNGGMGTSQVSFIPSIKQTLSLGPTYGVSIRHISEKYFS